MEELQDVLVVMGISHTQLFNGQEGIELIMLDPSTGVDFTLPITQEQVEIILAHKIGGLGGETEELRPHPSAAKKYTDEVRDPDEIDQF